MSILATEVGIYIRNAAIRRPNIWKHQEQIISYMLAYAKTYPNDPLDNAFNFAVTEIKLDAN